MYGCSRLGSSLSVWDFVMVGSSLSSSFARLGSALSVYGLARLASSFSVLDFMQHGSSLSLRSIIGVVTGAVGWLERMKKACLAPVAVSYASMNYSRVRKGGTGGAVQWQC